MMKAITVEQLDGQPLLSWKEAPEVRPGPEEVLVRIRATAVNRADLSQAAGHYPPPVGVTEILGLEMAGEIIKVGEHVADWKEGDRVCALLPGGGYAERATVHHKMLLPLPASWNFDQGAAIPEAWLTAYVNLFREGSLTSGERVLIHAGGSGVGTAAVQLAHISGAEAIVTAGTASKLATCMALGSRAAINYKDSDFEEEIGRITEGEGVDLILDPVGADNFERNIRLLRPAGRLVTIGLLSGSVSSINLGLVLSRSLRIIGSRLRHRPIEEKIDITRSFADNHWFQFEAGLLSPVIDTSFPVENAQEAHEYVRQNRNTGKVILLVS